MRRTGRTGTGGGGSGADRSQTGAGGDPIAPARSAEQSDRFEQIPLVWADLTEADQEAVLAALTVPAADGPGWTARWEAAWEDLWGRPAVAFADPGELIAALKRLLGWRSGEAVLIDGLAEPVWREALTAAWLHANWLDIDSHTALVRPDHPPVADPAAGPTRAQLIRAPFGLPTPPPARRAPVVLEDISATPTPAHGGGWGALQLAAFDGNRILPAGSGALCLSQDARLIAGLKQQRRHPPSPAACALGLSLLGRLEETLETRRRLARRYLAMRPRGLFDPPSDPASDRAWSGFCIRLASAVERDALAAFLNRSGIRAAAPPGYRVPQAPELVGLRAFLERSLCLPLYPALEGALQKRVINRLHRWVERRAKERRQS